MLKLLAVALTLGAFAMIGVTSQAGAQFRPCIKNNPKDNVPCLMAAEGRGQIKLRSR
jgi:hypothetical protein